MDANERIVLEPECKAITALGRTTRFHLEREGRFPRRRQISNGRVGWLHSELVEWMQTRTQGVSPAPEEALKARGVEMRNDSCD